MAFEQDRETALVATGGSTALVPQKEEKKSYWKRIRVRYGATWRLLLIAAALFAVLFVLLFSRSFTYDSILCFFEDLQAAGGYYPGDYATVYATYGEGESSALSYRGGVAFVTTSGVEVYSPNGERSLDVSHEMEHPRALASRKYLLCFDHGKNDFFVTNSYAELYRAKTDNAILGAAIADDGHFALITMGEDTLSEVLLYDNNFNLVTRFKRASATVGVAIADNGRYIALLGAEADGGEIGAVLDIFPIGEKEAEQTLAFAGEMPLALGFTDDKNVALLTDTALHACRVDGEVYATHQVAGEIVAFSVLEEGTLLVTAQDGTNATRSVLALDHRGKVAYTGEITGDPVAVTMDEDEIFILLPECVMRLEKKSGDSEQLMIGQGAIGLFQVGKDAVRIVYPAKAEYLRFGSK